jgi:hypothetical protein
MPFSIDEFQSELFAGSGLAEQNRFEMLITAPPALSSQVNVARRVSMYCEISNFPPLNLLVRQLNLYGPLHQRPVSLDYGGDGIAASFFVDRQMEIKGFFDKWMMSIVDEYKHDVAYQYEYITNIEITQLDRNNNPRYTVVLEEAFPRSMNLMDLNMAAQNQMHRLTVVFAFRKWTAKNLQGQTNTSYQPSPGAPPAPPYSKPGDWPRYPPGQFNDTPTNAGYLYYKDGQTGIT